MPSGPIGQLPPSTDGAELEDVVISACAQGVVDSVDDDVVSACAQGTVDSVPDDVVSAATQGAADTVANLTVSAAAQGITDADGDGNAMTRVPMKAHLQIGGLDLQVDTVPQGGINRRNLNLINTDNEPAHPVGVQEATSVDLELFIAELGLQGFRFPELGRLATVTGIDGLVAADTLLYTVPSGSEAVILGAVVICSAASGISAPATAGVGSNGAADDIFASQALTGLTAAGLAYTFPEGGTFAIAGSGSTINLGIDAGATGTSQSLSVHLIGYTRPE